MNIEKLPSGSYRIRQMVDGKNISVTIDHKPKKREAVELLVAKHAEQSKAPKVKLETFGAIAKRYTDSVSAVLSPSTAYEYDRTRKYMEKHFPAFMRLEMRQIRSEDIQMLLNAFASSKDSEHNTTKAPTRSAKSVRNLNGFIGSVTRFYDPTIHFYVTLPKRPKKPVYIPTDDNVRKVAEYIRDTDWEVPVMLASMALRRSEIIALSMSDLHDDDTLCIHRSIVYAGKRKWTEKDYGKTPDSTRTIKLPHGVAERIRELGLYHRYPGSITKHLKLVQNKLGIPEFSVHKMRHYYASSAIVLGVPFKYIQRHCGWKNDTVLREVYTHVMEDKIDEMDARTATHIGTLFG